MTDMTTSPNYSQPPADDWQPAAGNEVVRLARHMRDRKGRRQFLTMGGRIVAGLLAAAGGWWMAHVTTREQEFDFGGITCSEVAARADDLMQGRLPADEAARVRQHVLRCPNCKLKFDKMGGIRMVELTDATHRMVEPPGHVRDRYRRNASI